MAAASPALSSNSADTTSTSTTVAAPATAVVAAATAPLHHRVDAAHKTQRGLNKPKCIQCGNVARSRCPYRSCKSCCSKAQNPCHIHVLKASTAFPEKTPTLSTPDQKSSEASSAGTGMPSLRQLSTAFAQFNNLQMPFRPKKHLTRKDAISINEWRFSKLKEYKDRNIEVENEAFDRYMQNVSLLEELFSTESVLDGSDEDGSTTLTPDPISKDGGTGKMISGPKLRSYSLRTENYRKRIRQIVDQGLKDLRQYVLKDTANGTSDQNELDSRPKKAKTLWADRAAALDDLMDKLNKARDEDDLKSCLEIKAQLYGQSTVSTKTQAEDLDTPNEQTANNDLTPGKSESVPKLYTAVEIDQETLTNVNTHFSSLEQIEDL